MANVKVVTHPIGDNQIRINNDEYFLLGAEKVITGVENTNRQEILKNPNTGLNYSRNAVEGQEIYNLHTQAHHPWFLLDLETGSKGWYPGCEIHGDIIGSNVPIKSAPSDEAITLKTVSGVTVRILEIDAIDQEPFEKGWYKVRYDIDGYVKKDYVSGIRYENPF